ncbi:hypothetical protein WS94_21425 [Burkholderia territorii]|nr:hypothetical protein WS94_21425 [Burkholderia territorii]
MTRGACGRGTEGAEVDKEDVVLGRARSAIERSLNVRSVFSPKRTTTGCPMRPIPNSLMPST